MEALNIEPGIKVFESRGFKDEYIPKQVDQIKQTAGALWSMINALPTSTDESRRLAALAKTELESSVMWAVKAASRA